MLRHRLSAFLALIALTGCDDGGSGGTTGQTYSLKATVSGLSSDGLTLNVNGSTVPVGNGASTIYLSSNLSSGAQYTITVATQPTGQTCSVAGGSGSITSANVANVVVTCSAQAYDLGGTIIGLNGAGLVLSNGADTLAIPAGATSFTMPTKVAYNSSYAVAISRQPAGITCAVAQGSGTMPAAASSSVVLTCSDQPFTVGGSIAGLGANAGLVLANGNDTLTVAANAASFVMPGSVPFGSSYSVTVQSNPPGLSCSAYNGSGSVGADNVTDVAITCSNRSFTVGGSITGLNAAGLVLANGSDTLSVLAGASGFTMMQPVSYTGSYSIGVQANPTGETCTVSGGAGIMGTNAVNSVVVTCSPNTHTVGGTISGLGANTGLVLLNNSGDPTPISANATSFTMNTGVGSGSAYSITVGTQPYGIALSCSVASGSGTANADVNSVSITCGSVSSLTATPIVDYLSIPLSAAVDAHGNLFIADYGSTYISEYALNSGVYSSKAIRLLPGVRAGGVRLDTAGNLFVGNWANGGEILKLPFTNGSYGATSSQVAGGLGYPAGLSVGASGNVFASITNSTTVVEIINTAGTYGAPFQVGPGFSFPNGTALDASGNLYVADNAHGYVDEVANSNGSYSASSTAVGSGFNNPNAVVVDAGGNVFVAPKNENVIKKVPFSAGSFGTPVAIGSGFSLPWDLVLDATGNIIVTDRSNRVIKLIPFDNGNYTQAPVTLGSGLKGPTGAAVDRNGNLFIADTGNNRVVEFLYNNGSYGGAPVVIAAGFNNPMGVALDASGNLFVADANNNAIKEFVLSNGSYSATAVLLGSGFNRPSGIAVDAGGNVFVADTLNGQIKKIAFSNGSYAATPITVASGITRPVTVAVDSSGNVFTVNGPTIGTQTVKEVVFSNGVYSSTLVSLGTSPSRIPNIALDRLGNIFLTAQATSAVTEIAYSNGAYAPSQTTVKSGFSSLSYLALDANGRVYAGDGLSLQQLTP
ncbi:MAG: hypothetical protein JSR66_20160 [Proteobacteria bacterium]|nr:hypothetical protein [Pseudomonadota bacterium]